MQRIFKWFREYFILHNFSDLFIYTTKINLLIILQKVTQPKVSFELLVDSEFPFRPSKLTPQLPILINDFKYDITSSLAYLRHISDTAIPRDYAIAS